VQPTYGGHPGKDAKGLERDPEQEKEARSGQDGGRHRVDLQSKGQLEPAQAQAGAGGVDDELLTRTARGRHVA
jgi:hypothetical protein